MEFDQYLIKKKIDPARFKNENDVLWQAWKAEYDMMHPEGFTARKLYLINKIRRSFPIDKSDMPAN